MRPKRPGERKASMEQLIYHAQKGMGGTHILKLDDCTAMQATCFLT